MEKLFFVLIFNLSAGSAMRLPFPSNPMMNDGYVVHSYSATMYLERKGIQYIPNRIFRDFPNITVSVCDFIIARKYVSICVRVQYIQ